MTYNHLLFKMNKKN